jgi:hypothetical protein
MDHRCTVNNKPCADVISEGQFPGHLVGTLCNIKSGLSQNTLNHHRDTMGDSSVHPAAQVAFGNQNAVHGQENAAASMKEAIASVKVTQASEEIEEKPRQGKLFFPINLLRNS